MGKIPEGLKKFLLKRKKKAANPNLRPGTKQSRKNLMKEVMKGRRKPATPNPARPKRLSPKETEKIIKKQIKEGKKPRMAPMPMLKRGGSVKKKKKGKK